MRVVWSVREVAGEGGAVDRVDRRLGGPHVGQHGGEGIADRAEDVAGVLSRHLVAEGLVFLPCGRDGVPELVEQGLVVPEHHGRQVVAGAVDMAVDRDRVERARRVAVEPTLGNDALVERRGKGLNAVLLVGRPAGVVHLSRPRNVGPARAGLVEQRDLGVERVATPGAGVVGLDVERALGVVLLEGLGDGRAVGVDPDGDRAVSDLLRGGEAVLCCQFEEPADSVGPLLGVPEPAVPVGPLLGELPEQPATTSAMQAAAADTPINVRGALR